MLKRLREQQGLTQDELAKKAKLTKPRPWKTLRATFITRKIGEGVDVATVAAMAGLSSAHVLEHYYRPFQEQLEKAMSDRE